MAIWRSNGFRIHPHIAEKQGTLLFSGTFGHTVEAAVLSRLLPLILVLLWNQEHFMSTTFLNFLTPIYISRNRSSARVGNFSTPPPPQCGSDVICERAKQRVLVCLLVHLPQGRLFRSRYGGKPHGHVATSSVPLDTSRWERSVCEERLQR